MSPLASSPWKDSGRADLFLDCFAFPLPLAARLFGDGGVRGEGLSYDACLFRLSISRGAGGGVGDTTAAGKLSFLAMLGHYSSEVAKSINALRVDQLTAAPSVEQVGLGTGARSKEGAESMRYCGPATVNVTEEVAMRVSAHSTMWWEGF